MNARNKTLLGLVISIILIVSLVTPTNVFAQEPNTDPLAILLKACAEGKYEACYYADLIQKGKVPEVKNGGETEFQVGQNPFGNAAGEPLDCTKESAPVAIFSVPFDWVTSTNLGDPNKDHHVLAIFQKSDGTQELYAIQSSWSAYFEDAKLLGSHAQYTGTFESVLCKAQDIAKAQGIDKLYVIGSITPPAGWSEPVANGLILMKRTVRTGEHVEVKNAEIGDPINLSLKAGNVIDCPQYYCIAQTWDGKNSKILDHFLVFQGNKVTIADAHEGTIWPIKIVDATQPADVQGMISLFQQMMQEKMDAEHPDTINAYVVAPTSGWTPPTGLLPATLPANWTVSTSP